MSWLDAHAFRTVVDATPLVAIDLVVVDRANQILLGRRNNRPAQGYWFVPGGRIRKNESLDEAFRRLTQEELGLCLERNQARFLNVYEHLYDDSIFGDTVSTHYVVLGYQLFVERQQLTLPDLQHNEYRWWDIEEMSASTEVHENSRAYLASLNIHQ